MVAGGNVSGSQFACSVAPNAAASACMLAAEARQQLQHMTATAVIWLLAIISSSSAADVALDTTTVVHSSLLTTWNCTDTCAPSASSGVCTNVTASGLSSTWLALPNFSKVGRKAVVARWCVRVWERRTGDSGCGLCVPSCNQLMNQPTNLCASPVCHGPRGWP